MIIVTCIDIERYPYKAHNSTNISTYLRARVFKDCLNGSPFSCG